MNHRTGPPIPDPAATPPFRLGEWLVQPALRRLSCGDRTAQVEPRVMHVLVCLAARPGEVVSRADLLESVWSGVVVNEEALTQTISQLRHIFGDDPRSARYIETIHKSGYRLVAPVSSCEPGSSTRVLAGGRAPERGTRRGRWALLAAAGVVLAAAVLAGLLRDRRHTGELASPIVLGDIPFTSSHGREIMPALSPDGTRVAFSWSGEGEDDTYDLYLKPRDSESWLRLTDMPGQEYFAAWSPNGTTLAFVHRQGDEAGIYTVPAAGGAAQLVLDVPGGVYGLDWSPDGEDLAYSARAESGEPGETWAVHLYSFAARSSRRLTQPPAGFGGDICPAFSPDGRAVAFVRVDRSGLQDLYLVPTAPADGESARALTSSSQQVEGFDWERDGEHLVFSSGPSSIGELALWRLRLDDGALTALVTRARRPARPSLALRAPGLVYEDRVIGCSTLRIRTLGPDRPDTTSVPFIASTRSDYSARYSPSGKRIAFVSTRSGDTQIWMCDSLAGSPVQLTSFTGANVDNPCWSPDERTLAFDVSLGGRWGLHVLEVESGAERRLSASDHHERVLGWSRDSRWIYFRSEMEGDWQTWKRPLAGGADVKVLAGDALALSESSDGREILYSRADRIGIWIASLDGTNDRCLLGPPDPVFCLGWRVTERGVYYLQRDARAVTLWWWEAAAQERTRVATMPDFFRFPGFGADVAPDGTAVLYDKFDPFETDLTLVEAIP